MKIAYRAQGSGNYTTLADDAAGATLPISGFQPRMAGVPQISRLFRAPNVAVFARGNRQWELKGTVQTDHGTAAAATAFINTQAAAIPDYVDVQITQDASVIYLTPAVFVGFEPRLIGESSSITYMFVGGKVTSVAP
jgi:hypothetical protein